MTSLYIQNLKHLASFRVLAWGAKWDDFSGQFFRIFEIIIFCFVVAICDLVHSVEAMYDLP